MRRHPFRLVWFLFLGIVLLTATALANGNSQASGDSETQVGITVNPPTSGGGALIESTAVSSLDLEVSPDNCKLTEIVRLNLRVDQAVSSIRISAEISNKNQMKIKWYNLLANGHFLINGKTGADSSKGNSWDFGVVWSLGGDDESADGGVLSGDYTVEIPVTLDLSAGGSVNPYDIPAGTTSGKSTIVWTLSIGTL